MKRLVTATTLALGLAGISGVSTAQDQTRTVEMRDISVTAVSVPYEAYEVDLPAGFTFHTLIGHTRRQYVEAQREADRLESLRKRGMAMQPLVSVAVDDYSGTGAARQFQLLDAGYNTIAIVDVYCKRKVSEGSPRCRLVPMHTASMGGERLGATQAAVIQVAQADPRN